MNTLRTLEETAALIEAGERLLLAGDEEILMKLPKGDWAAGTSPYFVTEQGSVTAKDRISVSILPPAVTAVTTQFYDSWRIGHIAADGPGHGFTFLIIPGFSPLLQQFAENVQDYPGIYNRPLLGWVSGVALEERGTVRPKVVNGMTKEASADMALALHATLDEHIQAEVGIANPFIQGTGDTIRVDKSGFLINDVSVNGQRTNFARYIRDRNIDIRLPLVANYSGAMVNVSIKRIDLERGETMFYAPLFPNVEYRLAAQLEDYGTAMTGELQKIQGEPTIVVNCLLNCIYGPPIPQEKTIAGVISFGEIAYGLLNQTAVYLLLRPS